MYSQHYQPTSYQTMAENHSKTELDLSGLLCPLPVLKARKHLMAMTSGHVLKVIATDPMSAIDMPHFCTEQGHTLPLESEPQGEHIPRQHAIGPESHLFLEERKGGHPDPPRVPAWAGTVRLRRRVTLA